jgi:hypothetical protein
MATVRGGDRVKGRLDDFVRKIESAKTVKVGFIKGATYPEGTSVPLVAAINEFGRPPYQPPRPFFRRMIAAHKNEWPAAISNLLKSNDYDARTTLAQVGDAIAGQLRQSIVDLVDPPLAPSTIARKGGVTKPLIDTGVMLASIAYQVE